MRRRRSSPESSSPSCSRGAPAAPRAPARARRSSTPRTSTAASTRWTRSRTGTSAEGLARVATVVRKVRAEGRPVLLLDSGDTIQGSPEQALAFAREPGGKDPIVDAMNLVGYDAMAVGNHDFDFGRERLAASQRQARFPMLSANALGADGRQRLRAVRREDSRRRARRNPRARDEPDRPNWLSPTCSRASGSRTPSPSRAPGSGPFARTRSATSSSSSRTSGSRRTRRRASRDPAGAATAPVRSRPRCPGVDLVLAGPRPRRRRAAADRRRLGLRARALGRSPDALRPRRSKRRARARGGSRRSRAGTSR